MIKHISCYVLCIVLMLTWSLNVFADGGASVSFNISNNKTINLSEDDTELTITASDTSVTDFDVYINKEFYKNLAGYSVNINLKTLGKLGSVYIEAYANGADGVLAQNSLNLTLKDVQKDYLYYKDMEDIVDGVLWGDTSGTFTGGYMNSVEIDEEHGKSMALGTAPEFVTAGVNLWFGPKALTRTDVTHAVFECDLRITDNWSEIYIATPAVANAGVLWNFGINSSSIGSVSKDTWHHVKWVLDLDTDTYSFTIDGNNIPVMNSQTLKPNEYDYITGHFRLTAQPVSGKSAEVIIDNMEYYNPAGEKPAAEITDVADSNGNNVIAANSEYVKATLSDAFGEVTAENIKIVNSNGEQEITSVMVDEADPTQLYIYPKGGFMTSDECYLTVKKDTPLENGKTLKDLCYKFNTETKDTDFAGGVVIKQAGKLSFTAKLSNQTAEPQNACLVMYINKDGTFEKLYSQDITIPVGADNEPFSISATENIASGSVGYGFVVSNMTDLTPISNKLIQSQAY